MAPVPTLEPMPASGAESLAPTVSPGAPEVMTPVAAPGDRAARPAGCPVRSGAKPATHERPLVIIPAWNEQAPLPSVLDGLHRQGPECDIVVVSDGSTDHTAEVARANGARVVELPYNLGIGGALRTGFRYAVRNGYQRAVQFDADGQHEPTQIQALLDALDQGADLAIGSRFAGAREADSYRVGRLRGGAMGLLRFTVRRVTKQPFTDTSSGFRGFSRPMLEFFAETYPHEYMESVEALLMAHRAGFSISEVPALMRERQDGLASNRKLKLIYHYVRLLLVIVAAAPGRRKANMPSAAQGSGASGSVIGQGPRAAGSDP